MSKEHSNSKPKQTRRSFTDEFKIEAVKMVTEQGFKAAEVARSLDVNENLIHRWKANFSQPESDTENEELKHLREEAKRLRMERDILPQEMSISNSHFLHPLCF
jgi:transposase